METIWAIFKSITSNLKLPWLVLGQFLETIGVLFISKSGHTARSREIDKKDKNGSFDDIVHAQQP